MNLPPVVSREEWAAAGDALRAEEKEATRARDALAAERRRLPMVRLDKPYELEGPDGRVSLLDVFDGRPQLILYRFFFDPGMDRFPDAGCVGCSMFADQVSELAHLHARDVTLAFASRAPQPDIARLKARMGWEPPWYTIVDDFDRDLGVDEYFGLMVILRDGDDVFLTYQTGGRGVETLGTVWSFLDISPLGRQEEWEDTPPGRPQTPPYGWWNRHDEYGERA